MNFILTQSNKTVIRSCVSFLTVWQWRPESNMNMNYCPYVPHKHHEMKSRRISLRSFSSWSFESFDYSGKYRQSGVWLVAGAPFPLPEHQHLRPAVGTDAVHQQDSVTCFSSGSAGWYLWCEASSSTRTNEPKPTGLTNILIVFTWCAVIHTGSTLLRSWGGEKRRFAEAISELEVNNPVGALCHEDGWDQVCVMDWQVASGDGLVNVCCLTPHKQETDRWFPSWWPRWGSSNSTIAQRLNTAVCRVTEIHNPCVTFHHWS